MAASSSHCSLSGMVQVQLQVQFTLEQATKVQREKRHSSTLSLTLVLDVGGWSTPRSGIFTHGNQTVTIVQVWTGAENLAPTFIRTPDRPARSELLYWLSYPGTRDDTVGVSAYTSIVISSLLRQGKTMYLGNCSRIYLQICIIMFRINTLTPSHPWGHDLKFRLGPEPLQLLHRQWMLHIYIYIYIYICYFAILSFYQHAAHKVDNKFL
jgi:hypothetical protein